MIIIIICEKNIDDDQKKDKSPGYMKSRKFLKGMNKTERRFVDCPYMFSVASLALESRRFSSEGFK